MKMLSVLFICFTLLIGSVASAAMPCCITDIEQPTVEMQVGDMEMPCHETVDNNAQDTAFCDGCDCQHCVKMTVLPAQQVVKDVVISSPNIVISQSIYLHHPEGVFQPPKQLS